MDKDTQIAQLTETVHKLKAIIASMERTAVTSAVSLLHSFGISGNEAETKYTSDESDAQLLSGRLETYKDPVKIERMVVPPTKQMDSVIVEGHEIAFAGRVSFSDAVLVFDHLVPLGVFIDQLQYNGCTLVGVIPLEYWEDCTYRCSIDLYTNDGNAECLI